MLRPLPLAVGRARLLHRPPLATEVPLTAALLIVTLLAAPAARAETGETNARQFWAGWQLPSADGLYERWDPRRSWGASHLIEALQDVSHRVAFELPMADPIMIGDISHRGGGRMPWHRTHDKGIDVDSIPMDPSLPEMTLAPGAFAKWIGMMDDVDVTCVKTVEYLKGHPLIPDDITISGWIWETEFRRLRAPTTDNAERARTQYAASEMGVKGSQPPRWA